MNYTEYQQRRIQLASSLQQNSVAIIPAAREVYRNGDAHYRFRQDSSFYYLTGFHEPDAVLIIQSGRTDDSILFTRPNNPAQEQWTGKRLGITHACYMLGVAQALAIDVFDEQLPELLANLEAVYYAFGTYPEYEEKLHATIARLKSGVRRGIKAPGAVLDLTPILSEMRLFKSENEMALMRQAAEISVAAHRRAMQVCRQVQWEYELEAEILYEFTRRGSRSPAYDCIVGSGERACILHYTANNGRLKSGDLVLIDAGAEYHNYAADITRTFPVNGQFTPAQRDIYQLVLSAQQAGIACIKPGISWDSIQKTMLKILTAGLVDLGILQGDVDILLSEEAYKPYYMHNSGHWLGLDVHDAGYYKVNQMWRTLQPGMVLTVEPGLYLSDDIPDLDPYWHNIGVRIEDDILVTEDGYENLTAALPKTIQDIEALMCETA